MTEITERQPEVREWLATSAIEWPADSEHHARVRKLAEFYTADELGQMLNHTPGEVREWVSQYDGGRKWDYHGLTMLNHLDAAVTVTRTIEPVAGPDQVHLAVFKPFEMLDGRSLADIVASPQSLEADRMAKRLVEALRGRRK